jgi:hypothetical protein
MTKSNCSSVSLKKHLSMRVDYVEAASRERDVDAEKRELERFDNLTHIMTANAAAQAKAVDLALTGTAAMADRLAEANATSTERIVTRLEAVEKAILTGSSQKAGVESWWTKARINTAATIGFLGFLIMVGTNLAILLRG